MYDFRVRTRWKFDFSENFSLPNVTTSTSPPPLWCHRCFRERQDCPHEHLDFSLTRILCLANNDFNFLRTHMSIEKISLLGYLMMILWFLCHTYMHVLCTTQEAVYVSVCLSMHQNTPENIWNCQSKLIAKISWGSMPPDPPAWTTAGRPCSLLHQTTLPPLPTDKKMWCMTLNFR